MANTSDKPPDYDSEIAQAFSKSNLPDESLPSYQSLFEQISSPVNEVRRALEDTQSSGLCCKCCSMCCKLTLGLFTFLLGCGVPVMMIAVGVFAIQKCPLQAKIPYWLVIFGVGILITFITEASIKLFKILKRKLNESELKAKNAFTSLIAVFLISWFLAGNVWVYQTVNARQGSDNNNNYCDRTCYLMSFWTITSIWILITVFCFFCCCCCAFFLIINRRYHNNNASNNN